MIKQKEHPSDSPSGTQVIAARLKTNSLQTHCSPLNKLTGKIEEKRYLSGDSSLIKNMQKKQKTFIERY